MIFENFINFVDRNYHHKRIVEFLKKYKIDLILDIGSHKGEFIKNITPHISFKKVYSFEPQKDIFDILKNNFINDKRIIISNLGVSNTITKKKFYLNKLTSTSSFQELDESSIFLKIKNFLLDQNNQRKVHEVETTTIDNYFKNFNLKNSLLKIDVEGHEINVLKGAINTLKEINFIIIEKQFFNLYKNINFNECNDILVNNNFMLLKKFRFPTLHFEDRIYKKIV